jgi:hypothetical protein
MISYNSQELNPHVTRHTSGTEENFPCRYGDEVARLHKKTGLAALNAIESCVEIIWL